jgi:hypothetical protein
MAACIRMIIHSSLVAASLSAAETAAPSAPCRIQIVEKGTTIPVPLVELRTTHHARFVSDNAGVIAFDLPEFMGREVWFEIIGQGYEVPKDGFGNRGVRVTPEPGRRLTIEVERRIIARRVGRLTGGGLLAESQRCGEQRDGQESGIIGCDSVQCVAYQGRLHWLWGDSGVPQYPLGIFNSTGATSPLLTPADLTLPLRVPLAYFHDERGQPRAISPLSGPGPTWVFGIITMKDKTGAERMGGFYSKIRGVLEPYEAGLTVWNDAKQVFERHLVVWEKSSGKPLPRARPDGEAVHWHEAPDRDWLLFGGPFPFMRCPATFEAWSDPATWEALTPQAEVPTADGGKITPHGGSIGWWPTRKRWVAIFTQKNGKPSLLGELWYAEADQPTGPWGPAVKVLSHENYTFYNPRLHTEFTPDGGKALYFEGSYNTLFTDNQAPTPRYEYNQILYKLDLDDPALAPAHGK